MNSINKCLLFFAICTLSPIVNAGCCVGKLGISYCDSSAGRYVCGNGYYSSCYCTKRAVMDIQKVAGCCLWKNGVYKVMDKTGLVICNNGGISPICSLNRPQNWNVSVW